MAKKAKVNVYGYVKDLKSWFGLMKQRAAFIESGEPVKATPDRVEELAKALHPDKTLAVIEKVIDETPSTRSFILRACEGSVLPAFQAGQHISVKFLISGKYVTRPFSVASAPGEAANGGTIQLTVRKKPGGYVTEWVWNNWGVGSAVEFDGAFGDGYWSAIRDTPHVVAVAGGSGITAFRSIARDMAVSRRPEKLTILYGSRNEDDIIFGEELRALADASGGAVELVNILSEPGEAWTGETGFISAEIIKKLVPDWQSVSFFISGPPAMYDYLERELGGMGVRSRFIRMEEYGEVDDVLSLAEYPRGHEKETFRITVRFGMDERVIEALASDTVVVSLEKAGIAPDSHCRSGACGWCRSLLVDGEIWQRPQSDGVRAADRDMGYFHPCSAYPLSNLTIQVFSRL